MIILPTFCDKCGNELKNDNAKFCDKCGAEISGNQNKNNNNTTTVSGISCPHCGQVTQMGLPNCQNCGAPLDTEDYTTAIIIGYATLVLGLIFQLLWIITIILGIYLLTRKNNQKAKTHGIILTALPIVLFIIVFIIFAFLGFFMYY